MEEGDVRVTSLDEELGHALASSELSEEDGDEPLKQSEFRIGTIEMDFAAEDLFAKTRYGEQLCTIGLFFNMQMVVRQSLHPSEANPPKVDFVKLLNPTRVFKCKDEKGDLTFLEYEQYPYHKFEMTLDWYMKVHRKEVKNGLNGGVVIEPALVLRPDGKWALSETFKEFLNDIIETMHKLHEKGYTHGRLSPNNIVIKSSTNWSTSYETKIVNCVQHHDLEKEDEKELFEALVQKDWEDVLKLIEDINSGIEDCFDYEFTQFMKGIKISKEQKHLSKKTFNHPAIWLRIKKYNLIDSMHVKITAKKMAELGFLEAGVDWRKLVNEGILVKYQEDACYWMSCYRDDYNGEFNDSIQDLFCFIKDSYDTIERLAGIFQLSDNLNSVGFSAMDMYLQFLFPKLFVQLHQLEGTDAFPSYSK